MEDTKNNEVEKQEQVSELEQKLTIIVESVVEKAIDKRFGGATPPPELKSTDVSVAQLAASGHVQITEEPKPTLKNMLWEGAKKVAGYFVVGLCCFGAGKAIADHSHSKSALTEVNTFNSDMPM